MDADLRRHDGEGVVRVSTFSRAGMTDKVPTQGDPGAEGPQWAYSAVEAAVASPPARHRPDGWQDPMHL